MRSARDRVLAAVRDAIGDGVTQAARRETARARIARHARQIEPAFDDSAQQRFRSRLEAAQASFAAVDDLDAAAAEIGRYLDDRGLEKKLVSGMDDLLRRIAWPDSIEVTAWEANNDFRIGLTRAFCGIAETGTLVLLSGEGHPTGLNFLPDYHFVLLPAEDLVMRMEDAWDRIRGAHGQQLPRTVNFISGPSKTADIEQTVEYGAHGPRCLHVILTS